MKPRWMFWWMGNAIWLALFGLGSFVVWTREVDGAGVTQTPMLKFLAFLVLTAAFVIPLMIQAVWLFVILRKGEGK